MTSKAQNVVKLLPTPEERIAADKRTSQLVFNAEDDVRQLAILTALARHLYELEEEGPISPAGSPLLETLQNIEKLASDLWQRFYASEGIAV